MAKNDILLTRTEANAFAGIDSTCPIVLDLTEANAQGKNIAIAEGDQGTRKTSWLSSLYHLLTSNFMHVHDKESAINKKEETWGVNDEFQRDGVKYRVRSTKSRFTLERFWEYGTLEAEKKGQSGSWKAEENPKTMLKELIGNVGVSPMFLKELDGKKQNDWFRKAYSVSDELVVAQKKLQEAFDIAYSSRTEANREYKRLEMILSVNELYKTWGESELLYKEEKTIEEANTKLSIAEKSKNNFEATQRFVSSSEDKVKGFDTQIAEIEEQIKQLQQRKANIETEKDLHLAKVQEAKTYLSENIESLRGYEEARRELSEVSNYILKYNEWQLVKTQKSEMDQFSDMVIKFDNQKDDLKKQIAEVTAKFTPKVEGFELCVPNEDDKREGIFYQGKTLAMLSESELWTLWLKVWDEMGVKFIFVENLGSLGTEAISTLNVIAKNGIRIFATQMNRALKTMKITFADQIPNA